MAPYDRESWRDAVAATIARKARERQMRAELQRARDVGLSRRHAAKLRHTAADAGLDRKGRDQADRDFERRRAAEDHHRGEMEDR